MSKIVLIHDESAATPDEVRHFLNARSEIVDWISIVPFAYFIQSDASVYDLSNAFQEYKRKNDNPVTDAQTGGRFAFFHVGNSQGWLNRAVWDKINQAADGEQPRISRLLAPPLPRPDETE